MPQDALNPEEWYGDYGGSNRGRGSGRSGRGISGGGSGADFPPGNGRNEAGWSVKVREGEGRERKGGGGSLSPPLR